MTVAAIMPRSPWRGGLAWRVIQSVVWSLVITGILILMAGKNPLVAYQHIVLGAFGSWDRVIVGLNKAAPYQLAGAKGAHLVEATYNEVTGAKTTPVRTIDVLAQTDDGVAFDLFLRAPAADFDRSGLRKVLGTFRLKP